MLISCSCIHSPQARLGQRCELALLALIALVFASGDSIAGDAQRKFSIRVCARLRPLPPDGAAAHDRARVVLPLHQRLQLIQAHERCNRTESQRRLWEPRGGLTDAWAAANVVHDKETAGGDGADIEMKEGADEGGWRETEADQGIGACILSAAAGNDGHVLMCCPAGAGVRRFAMDHVLTSASTQEETYAAAASEVVRQFLAGQNACIFAYGQTGSGKSHTMFGATDEASSAVPSCAAEACAEAGIVPRACSEILAEARSICDRGGHASVSLSFVELYGESINDLLSNQPDSEAATAPPAPEPSTTSAAPRPKAIVAAAVLRGRHAVSVRTPAECSVALAHGIRNRKRAGKNSQNSSLL